MEYFWMVVCFIVGMFFGVGASRFAQMIHQKDKDIEAYFRSEDEYHDQFKPLGR